VPVAWGIGSDCEESFRYDYPDMSRSKEEAIELVKKILNENNDEIFCNFGSEELAKRLLEIREDIWS